MRGGRGGGKKRGFALTKQAEEEAAGFSVKKTKEKRRMSEEFKLAIFEEAMRCADAILKLDAAAEEEEYAKKFIWIDGLFAIMRQWGAFDDFQKWLDEQKIDKEED